MLSVLTASTGLARTPATMSRFSRGGVFPTAARFLCTAHHKQAKLTMLEAEDSGIAVLTLGRAPANALGRQMVADIREALHTIRFGAKNIRVLMLDSALEKTFCAGADLKERSTMNPTEVKEFVFSLRQTFLEIENLPIPTIAAVNGFALGGGLELALSCDLRTCDENTTVGLPETSLAIIPGAGGTQRLSRLIGAAKAKELIFTARRIKGAEAFSYGIFNRISSPGVTAFDSALDLAREILPNGPIALSCAKLAIDHGMQVDISTGMKFEESYYDKVIPTKDRLEGLQAFKEKRKPQYKGE